LKKQNQNHALFLRILAEYLRGEKSEYGPIEEEVLALAKSHEVEGIVYSQTHCERHPSACAE